FVAQAQAPRARADAPGRADEAVARQGDVGLDGRAVLVADVDEHRPGLRRHELVLAGAERDARLARLAGPQAPRGDAVRGVARAGVAVLGRVLAEPERARREPDLDRAVEVDAEADVAARAVALL